MNDGIPSNNSQKNTAEDNAKARCICTVYRSAKVAGLYLYVPREAPFDRVPQELLERFGKAEAVMTLVLTAEKALARVSAAQVMAQIEENGYYLQWPPPPEPYMQTVHAQNSKMGGG